MNTKMMLLHERISNKVEGDDKKTFKQISNNLKECGMRFNMHCRVKFCLNCQYIDYTNYISNISSIITSKDFKKKHGIIILKLKTKNIKPDSLEAEVDNSIYKFKKLKSRKHFNEISNGYFWIWNFEYCPEEDVFNITLKVLLAVNKEYSLDKYYFIKNNIPEIWEEELHKNSKYEIEIINFSKINYIEDLNNKIIKYNKDDSKLKNMNKRDIYNFLKMIDNDIGIYTNIMNLIGRVEDDEALEYAIFKLQKSLYNITLNTTGGVIREHKRYKKNDELIISPELLYFTLV